MEQVAELEQVEQVAELEQVEQVAELGVEGEDHELKTVVSLLEADFVEQG